MNGVILAELMKRLNHVDLTCTSCGIHVYYTNRILKAENKENFKCDACLLVEKGFMVTNLDFLNKNCMVVFGGN